LKHKFLYPNYKYSPIRNKSKKCKKSNNTSYNDKQQLPLEANDIIKSREIESNKNTKLLQIKETQALSDYNDCQNNSTTPNLFIEPPLSLYSYITPIFHESFIPHYLSPEYKHSIAASSMMSGQSTYNPYINYPQYYQPQDYFIINDPILINENNDNTFVASFM
jgi:hypothetical protein